MKAVQHAWERLSNAMRLNGEAVMRFSSLMEVDRDEAIINLDLAFEATVGRAFKLLGKHLVTKHEYGEVLMSWSSATEESA